MTRRRAPDWLVETLGRRSKAARESVGAISDSLHRSVASKPSGVAARLFESWRASFGIAGVVAERRADRRRERIQAWSRGWIGEGAGCDADLFLFAAQSFYACVVKALAIRLVGSCDRSKTDDSEFWRRVETGELFRGRGFLNVVNGDVFQAIHHVEDGVQVSSALLEVFPDGPAEAPLQPASLRALYLDLFPREVRHALGEYYTPAPLVSHILDVVGFDPTNGQRVLDPMCGAGVFLTEMLARRLRAHGHAHRRDAAGLLGELTGIDLHPLAVLAARVAILSTLWGAGGPHEVDGPVVIPVHQGDAVLEAWNSQRRGAGAGCTITTPLGVFDCVEGQNVAEELAQELDRSGAWGDADALTCDAEALANLSQFDLVVGNPPWVGWESLPADYRRRTAPMLKSYGLFQQRGMETILGGGKKDLSMLATYAAADAWLKPGGKLGFVLAESAFRSVGAARGFRRFRLGDAGAELRVLRVDDMTRVDPFANAATRTTVLVLKKGEPTRYPVPCVQWTMRSNRAAVAQPTDAADPYSPWLTASPHALPLIRRMLGASDIRAYEGANTGGANGVYWLRVLEETRLGTLIVENVPSLGRSDGPAVRAEIEATHVHPLLRHQDVGRWRATPSLAILLLQDPIRRRGVPVEELRRSAPMTLAYVARFEEQLRRRAAYRRYFNGAGADAAGSPPFYSMFNVGPNTLAPVKVVWRRMTAPVEAAVVADGAAKPMLPQETLCFVPCKERTEAYFYAGMLNSVVVNAAALAASQGSTKSFGAPHLLKLVRIPTYDPSAEVHRRLAAASEAAERSNGSDAGVDGGAAAVYGFDEAEAWVLAEELDFLLNRR